MAFWKRIREGSDMRESRFNLQSLSAVGAFGLSALALVLPVNFVTESPGPTFNTLGEFNDTPLLSIEGATSYPASGRLDMTTVQVAGGPNSSVSALEVFAAWLEDSSATLPSDLVYAPSLTSDQVSAQNSADMTNSQELAQAAALSYLQIDYQESLTVSGTAEAGPSAGILQEGDVLEAIDGQKVKTYQELTDLVNASAGREVSIDLLRDGQQQTLKVSPTYNEQDQRYVLGLYLSRSFDFPLTVTYGLEEVGGPSAGLMFSLGIIDQLTEGQMTGGKHFAGTGTIDSDGRVGAIGGIEQKMWGAVNSGASYFLAPADNCDAVIGNVPKGLTVIKVATLSDAVAAVEGIGKGQNPASFPTCS